MKKWCWVAPQVLPDWFVAKRPRSKSRTGHFLFWAVCVPMSLWYPNQYFVIRPFVLTRRAVGCHVSLPAFVKLETKIWKKIEIWERLEDPGELRTLWVKPQLPAPLIAESLMTKAFTLMFCQKSMNSKFGPLLRDFWLTLFCILPPVWLFSFFGHHILVQVLFAIADFHRNKMAVRSVDVA